MNKAENKILVFSHIEKCGGTTLLELLRTNLGLQHCDIILKDKLSNETQENDIKTAIQCYPRMISLSSHALKPYLNYGRYNEKLRFYTILRDPIDRYISDFQHDFYRRGFNGSICDWLKYDTKHNYMTKFIAGENNLDLAKEILMKRFDLIGIMERYEDFISALTELFSPTLIDSKFQVVNQAGKLPTFTISKKTKIRQKVNFDEEIYDMIREKNESDILLYDFAKTLSSHKISNVSVKKFTNRRQTRLSSYTKKQNRIITMLYRNLIYKPVCNEIPFSRYSLHQNKYNLKDLHKLEGL